VRRLRIPWTAVGVTAFVGCLALVIWMIWMLSKPQPAAVVLVGATYATNLAVPHNVLGWNGLAGIEQLSLAPRRLAVFRAPSLQLIRGGREKPLEGAHEWDDLIAHLAKGFSEQTLLIVVALHGGTKQGRAYLMPDAITEPAEGLDLEAMIASMDKLPKTKHKILVLDAATVRADWRLGMLHNDFARELKNLEPAIKKIPNLWVLSSCGVDQLSWSSEGLGRSVFLHYMIEGLRGEAAGSDRRLTLSELYNFVRARVRRWAWNARGALQEPMLLPDWKAAAGEESRGDRPDPGTIHLASAETAPAPKPPPSTNWEGLRKAWAGFVQLDALVPHAAVYTPQKWREYRAALIRYEELVRASTDDRDSSVVRMADRVAALEAQLRDGRFLTTLSSALETSLVGRALAGTAVEPSGPPAPDFVRFATMASPGEAEKLWSSLEAGEIATAAESPRPLRSRLAEYMLGFAAEDPAKNLKRAAERIKIAQGSDELFPAETHFLRMLNLRLPSLDDYPALVPAVKHALRVRALAERAVLGVSARAGEYAYAEQVHPWTMGTVEKADLRRGRGEDQLFSHALEDWTGATNDLTEAETLYQEAERRASRVRFALATQQRVLGVLPEYSRWLAHRHSSTLRDDLARRMSELWIGVHKLDGQLERREFDGELTALEQAARAVDTQFGKLAEQFTLEATTESARVAEDWEAAAGAAAVGFRDNAELAIRSKIWTRLDNIRKNDLDEARLAKAGSASAAEPPSDAAKVSLEHARRRAVLEGTMALAALGEKLFQDPIFKNEQQADYKTTSELVQQLAETDRAEAWRQDAARAGERIGIRFRGLAPEISRLASQEHGASNSASFQAGLARADRLARLVSALPEQTTEATMRLRALRVHGLLIWLARRCWKDHWYGENPEARPYYQSLSGRYLADASKLAPELDELVNKARAEIGAGGRLELQGVRTLSLTSESAVRLSFRVVDAGSVPPGLPVVRPLPDAAALQVDGPAGFKTAPRNQREQTVDFRVSSPIILDAEKLQADNDARYRKPRMIPASFRAEGFFRGQIFSQSTALELHPVPDVVAIGPAIPDPPRASIALRAHPLIIQQFGEGTGALSIVLDCSGSMVAPRTKFEDAKKALASVLAQVPTNTTVSLWTFSQFPEGKKENEVFENDPIVLEPERTINQLRPPDRWHPNQVKALTQKLDGLRPWFGTPLVQAMWKATETDLMSARGFKTLLVLTDGDDTRFDKNKTFNPKSMTIPEFIAQRYANLGIRVNMVFFTASDDPAKAKAELEQARANFAGALERLDTPGRFFEAKNLTELVTTLRRAADQKLRCQVEQPDGTLVRGDPLEVTNPAEEEDRWWLDGLDPARYKLRVIVGKPYQDEINLEKGDRLIVQLVADNNGGIQFERSLYGADFADSEFKETAQWRLTVLADNLIPAGGVNRLSLLTALESKIAQRPLAQLNPRMAWFSLSGPDLPQPQTQITQRWRERVTFPAPVWHLDVPEWPGGGAGAGAAGPGAPAAAPKVTLDSWWLEPNQPPPDATEVRLDESEDARDVRVEDQKTLRIESVMSENHLVEVQSGARPESRLCLVVRLAYPDETPYLVDPGPLRQLQIPGYEHRFYSQAGKYTGVFWPITESQREKVKSLRLVSLARFQQAARKKGTHLSVKLPRPKADDKLPAPPQAIRQ
jgi:hypothetical protein